MISVIDCIDFRRFLANMAVIIVCTAHAIFFTGCAVPSARSSALGVVSHSLTIEDMKKRACNSLEYPCQDWTKADYHRAETGNPVYREIRGPNCWFHWEVGPGDRIVGSRLEGRGCGPGVASGQTYSPWYGPNSSN